MVGTNLKALLTVVIMVLVIAFMMSDCNKSYVHGVFGNTETLPTPSSPQLKVSTCKRFEKGGVVVCTGLFESWVENTNGVPVVVLKMTAGSASPQAQTEWKKEFAPHEKYDDPVGIGDQFYIFKDKTLLGIIEPYQAIKKQKDKDNQIRYEPTR